MTQSAFCAQNLRKEGCGPWPIPCLVNSSLRDQKNFHNSVAPRCGSERDDLNKAFLMATVTTGPLTMTGGTQGLSNSGSWTKRICNVKIKRWRSGHEFLRETRSGKNQAVEASIVHTSPNRKRAVQHQFRNPNAHSRTKYRKFVQKQPGSDEEHVSTVEPGVPPELTAGRKRLQDPNLHFRKGNKGKPTALLGTSRRTELTQNIWTLNKNSGVVSQARTCIPTCPK